MLTVRVIPVLLIRNKGLVKGSQFKNHRYVGDPINAVKIFNEKEVDELVFLDIDATGSNKDPDFFAIKDIASEAFMPLAYGGGIRNLKQIEKLFGLGIEKVVINSAAYHNPDLISESSKLAGSQAIVVSIDVKRNLFGGYEVVVENATRKTKQNPVDYAKKMEDLGAGEIILTSVEREGTRKGYDLELIASVCNAVSIPVIAQGGAASLQDFSKAVFESQASAVAAGDIFIFYGKHKAVLITYPKYTDLVRIFTTPE